MFELGVRVGDYGYNHRHKWLTNNTSGADALPSFCLNRCSFASWIPFAHRMETMTHEKFLSEAHQKLQNNYDIWR